MKDLLRQIKQLPNGDNLLRLFKTAKQELGNSALMIRDYNERDEGNAKKRYGRYELDKATIWIQMGHPDNVIEYTLAHEIGHLMQDSKGFPRVSIRDILREYVDTNSCEPLIADVIRYTHSLTDKLSNLFLNPGADSFARAHNLCSPDALLYMRQKDMGVVNSQSIPAFNGKNLEDGINKALNSIKKLASFNNDSWRTTRISLDTALLALVYADLHLRYSQAGLSDPLDREYKSKQPEVYVLGNELICIVSRYSLDTATSCQEVASNLISYLSLPLEAVGIKVSQHWIS